MTEKEQLAEISRVLDAIIAKNAEISRVLDAIIAKNEAIINKIRQDPRYHRRHNPKSIKKRKKHVDKSVCLGV